MSFCQECSIVVWNSACTLATKLKICHNITKNQPTTVFCNLTHLFFCSISKVLVIQTKPLMQHSQLLHGLTHICTMFYFPFSYLWKDFSKEQLSKKDDCSYVYVNALTTMMGQNWKHTCFTDTFLNFMDFVYNNSKY